MNIEGVKLLKTNIKKYIEESADTKKLIVEDDEILNQIELAGKIIVDAYKNNKKVLLAGNGGSAADAQHIAGELVSKFLKDREPLNAMALTTNMSVLTAIGNDYSHEYVFEKQVQAYGSEGDVFIAISTSGNSENIIRAVQKAKTLKMKVIGLCGNNKCKMDDICDCLIKVPSSKTPIIQESQITIGHAICEIVENELFQD